MMAIPRAHEIVSEVRKEDRPQIHPKGRRCTTCTKTLSIYNGSTLCHACTLDRWGSRELGGISLRAIMEEGD